MSTPTRNFASDNHASVHPAVMDALQKANQGHAPAYGADPWTEELQRVLAAEMGQDCWTFPVFNGTGANVLSLAAALKPHEAVICTEHAHLQVDECGAPERFVGCKLMDLPSPDGKLRPQQVVELLQRRGDEHHVQPRMISITQSTELGTVYTQEEVRALAELAHTRGMLLHMDGARLGNAAASLQVSLAHTSAQAGVDILSLGGTKNGLMFGELVVAFREDLARDFKFVRKQGMQLASKMRFVSAQFLALLQDRLWLTNASHANAMAQRLAARVKGLPHVDITQPVQANAVFARLPPSVVPVLQARRLFYVWNERTSEVRWMCAWDTQEADVDAFAQDVAEGVRA